MNADGSDEHLIGADEVFVGGLTFSADGAQIAYMSNEGGTWGIFIMNTDGSGRRRLTDADSNALFPVWRPIPAGDGEGVR